MTKIISFPPYLAALVLLVLLLLTACGGGGGGGSNPPPPPPRNAEALVFIASDGATITGQNALYAVEDDGSNQRLLSENNVTSDSDILSFAISPDNQWVAYIADHNGIGFYALYTVAISGGAPQQVSRAVSLTTRTVKSFQWSPDSQQLVFAANLDEPFNANNNHLANEVYIVNRDGSNQRKINGNIGRPPMVEARNPQWSPDGRYIVQEVATFSNGVADTWPIALNIYDSTITADNSRRLITTNTNRSIKNVHWSPDSNRLAFTADYFAQDRYQIYVIGVSGSPFVYATTNGDFNSDSEWSADGSELAYLDHPGINTSFPADLTTSPGDGATFRVLALVSNNNRLVKHYHWSPDGSQIAYTSDEDKLNVFELYVVSASGGARTKINGALASSGDVFDFQWSPDGSQIAYIANQQTNTVLELFVSNRNGTGNTKVSSGLSNAKVIEFDWSTDSALLAFSEGPNSRRSIADKLYVNRVDGSSLLQVNSSVTDSIITFSYIN